MARGSVRGHARRTPGGGTTRVRHHSRRTRGRGLVSPAHAWKLAKRAHKASRRRRRGLALGLGALAAGELAAWVTLRGLTLVLVTAAALALGAAFLAGSASGARL
jgi:hypothetical protein